MTTPNWVSKGNVQRSLLGLMLLCLPWTAWGQETTVETTPDSVIIHTKPQRAHYKVYASDWIGLLVETGKATIGREFMVAKDISAEAELGVRVMPRNMMLDFPLFSSFPGQRNPKAGPYAGLHFRWYPEMPVFGDYLRNFVGVNAGFSADMSLVYFRQLDLYQSSSARPILMYNVMDAEVFSLRLMPFIGFNDFWRAHAVRGFTFHGQLGYTFRWDKIQGDVRMLSISNEPRPHSFSPFRHYPTFRFGLGYAF